MERGAIELMMHLHLQSAEISRMTPYQFVRKRKSFLDVYGSHMRNVGTMNGLRFK